MIGTLLTRVITMLLGYIYPAYECFKTVEQRRPNVEVLRFWCQYWIIIALLTVVERFGDTFVSWLPMYGEAKIAFIVYLWYPKTKGTSYIYYTFLRPYVTSHESEIDQHLNELRTRALDFTVQYWQRSASFVQFKFFEVLQYIASQSVKPPAPVAQNSQNHPPPPAPPPPTVQQQQQAPVAPPPYPATGAANGFPPAPYPAPYHLADREASAPPVPSAPPLPSAAPASSQAFQSSSAAAPPPPPPPPPAPPSNLEASYRPGFYPSPTYQQSSHPQPSPPRRNILRESIDLEDVDEQEDYIKPPANGSATTTSSSRYMTRSRHRATSSTNDKKQQPGLYM